MSEPMVALARTKLLLKIGEIFTVLLSNNIDITELDIKQPWEVTMFSAFHRLSYKGESVLDFNPKAKFIDYAALYRELHRNIYSGCITNNFKEIKVQTASHEFNDLLYPEFNLTEELLFQYSLILTNLETLEFYKELVDIFMNTRLSKDIVIFWYTEHVTEELLTEFLLNMTAIKEKLC
ncbi:hypothetical protein [Escherichia phage BF17]|nr:hypothetical protein [Escherichia coli]MED6971214.1 hypothetical protein [Escherichia coli O157]QXN76125.1 hypothetical protein [Escherichia phage BF17]EGE5868292.1 hypothetical protein [Escherichia coli]MDI1143675.1 hypothetical protein [Escherichia coli]